MTVVNSDPDLGTVATLLTEATTAMLMRMPVTCTHPAGWKRPENWPLPAVREHAAADGSVTQTYRPMAVLEWCEYKLAEPERQARAAHALAARGSAE